MLDAMSFGTDVTELADPMTHGHRPLHGYPGMHPKSALTSLLLVAAVQSHAQSLGAVQGAVIIGRPLDIVVQSLGPAGDDASAQCVQADVRYGDMRLSPSHVDLSFEGDVAQAGGMLRVRTRLPVNEPFVTVEVRVGCPVRLTRWYTLLADVEPLRPMVPPPAAAAPIAAPSAATVPEDRLKAVAVAPADSPDPAARNPAPEAPTRSSATAARPAGIARQASKAKPMTTAPAAHKSAAGAQSASATPTSPAGPRLELQPVEIARPPGVQAGGDPAEAQASVSTQALAPSTEPDPLVLQELASLRAEQQRLLLAVESLNRELTAARSDRSDGILYALVGVIAVLLGALLWLLRRGAAPVAPLPTAPWWGGPAERADGADAPSAAVPPPAVQAQETTQSATVAESPPPPAASTASRTSEHMAGLEVSETGASVFQEVPIALLDVAALRELWEQVDFFESLGQVADAVATLQAFVLAHPRASEAPYLRWWALARKHGLETRSLQAMYEQHYQRLLAPPEPADGVESDSRLIQSLTRDWPGETARATLEAALASQPGDPAALLQVRTLAAFDDLIMLHGVLHGLRVLEKTPTAAPAAGTAPSDGALDFDWNAWTPTSSDAPALR